MKRGVYGTKRRIAVVLLAIIFLIQAGMPPVLAEEQGQEFVFSGELLRGAGGEEPAAEQTEVLEKVNTTDISDDVEVSAKFWVDGVGYTQDELRDNPNIETMVGESFSYTFTWKITAADISLGENATFEKKMFAVPGLSINSFTNMKMVIEGIYIGDWSLSYNQSTGVMKYAVRFNKYAGYFISDSVQGLMKGNGKFVQEGTDKPIEIGDASGTITILPSPKPPTIPSVQGGIGWEPSAAPPFSNIQYPFGKGVKWHTSTDSQETEPRIEWRMVYLNYLQEMQKAFVEGKPLEVTDGYCIIEDTLDESQQFFGSDANYKNDAPFFFEIPVMVPETGNILNSLSGVGDENYDGPGMVTLFVTGEHFTKLDTMEEVEKTPLSWIVVTDAATKRQKLVVNVGKLGTTDPAEGMTFAQTSGSAWSNPVGELQKLMDQCDNKAAALESGADSPLKCLDDRVTALKQVVRKAVNMPENAGMNETLKQEALSFFDTYTQWRAKPEIHYLSPLRHLNPDGSLGAPYELPDKASLEAIRNELKLNAEGDVLGFDEVYTNFAASLENLIEDQTVYLSNRTEYTKNWMETKAHYKKAQEFYESGKVYGFVMKYMTKITNTSMTTFSNEVQLRLGDKELNAEDKVKIEYSNAVTGNYRVGTYVLQKADSIYQTNSGMDDITEVEQDNSGLTGVKFEIYCGADKNTVPDLIPENLAHFLPKEASANGDTYRYTYTGSNQNPDIVIPEDELITGLETDEEGKLVLGDLAGSHSHWLVEKETPKGYYTYAQPIKLDCEADKVHYHLVPNVARAVELKKIDSHSGQPVEGAEFKLYRVNETDSNLPGTEVTGFVTKTYKGNTFYWQDGKGSETLKTNKDGYLYIHGLDAGNYYIEESAPAPGYKMPNPGRRYTFELEQDLPADAVTEGDFYRISATGGTVVENDPKTTFLEINKRSYKSEKISGAVFALFRWIGTEDEWEINPNDVTKWRPVVLTDNGMYMTTGQATETVTLQGISDEFRNITGAVTDAEGLIKIENIPVGHYAVAEIKEPRGYVRNFNSYYFSVNGVTLEAANGDGMQLFQEPENLKKVTGNIVYNSNKMAKIALIKYAEGENPPEIVDDKDAQDGATKAEEMPASGTAWNETKDGWKYQGAKIDTTNKGLQGATYKLFQQIGSAPNPSAAELETTELQPAESIEQYDTAVVVGSTDENGVLKLEDMKGRNGVSISELNPGNYYLVEVKAPEGYQLDQTPVLFPLNEKTFASSAAEPYPGLIKRVKNKELQYGIELEKTDAETVNQQNPQRLYGAGFTIKKKNDTELLKFRQEADGSYHLDTNGTVTEVQTGFNGKLKVIGLNKDETYVFTETKVPQGYEKPGQPVEITIKADGKLQNGVVYTETMVSNQRLKGEMSLIKKDAETNKPLPGAVFQLYRMVVETIQPGDPEYDPDEPDATRIRDEKVGVPQTTDADGKITFTGLEWEPNYFVQEIKAPEGYLLDESRLQFSIDAYSFTTDGKPIPVVFANIRNAKGVMGEVLLHKVDEEDPAIKLEDARFLLMKEIADEYGNKTAVPYGKQIYYTNADGEIRISLPPGTYYFEEVLPPDGYLYPENPLMRHYFEIEETNTSTPVMPIVEKTVTNKKGSCGLILQKSVSGTDVPVEGVTFKIYKGTMNQELLYFKKDAGGTYVCVPAGTQGAVTEVVTDEEGQVRASFPLEFVPNSTDDTAAVLEKIIYYQEISAPDGLLVDNAIKKIEGNRQNPGNLREQFWLTTNVENAVKKRTTDIEIQKTDGKTKRPLPGATFELRAYFGDVAEGEHEIRLGEPQVTDENGQIVFKDIDVILLEKVKAYHIVETKAPPGYELDETHHEVILNRDSFDEDYNLKPIRIFVQNSKLSGNLKVIKVDDQDQTKKLDDAEFELFIKDGMEWMHYGEWRYTTDENGEINLRLPYGEYYLIERAAPDGYLLGEPQPMEFAIGENNTQISLTVMNKLDPNPHGSVVVTKKDADNPEISLPDAEFYLYVMAADGKWHHYKERTYKTGADGKLMVEKLPFGTYCFKEVKAPDGYRVDNETEYRFTINSSGQVWEMAITNKRLSDVPPPASEPGTEPEPDNPDQTEDGKLPQTGQRWLIVIMLAVAGVMLVAGGKYLQYRRKIKVGKDR